MPLSPTNRKTPGAVARGFDAPPKTKPKADDGMPAGRPSSRLPWSIRVLFWVIYVYRNGTFKGLYRAYARLEQRAVVWGLLQYLKLYGLAVALTGGRVAPDEYSLRNRECAGCEGRVTIGPSWVARALQWLKIRAAAPRHYCGRCGCPNWYLARLVGWIGKNWWVKHYCPEERHTGTVYPTYVTVSVSGCGQKAFKIPGGRAQSKNAATGEQHVGDDA